MSVNFDSQRPLAARNGRALRVLGITRISTLNQDPKSLADQQALLTRWVDDRFDGPVDWKFIGGQGSGENVDRQQVAEAEELVGSGQYDLVVMEDLSRHMRRVHAVLFCELCEDMETRLIAINDGIDTAGEWRLHAFFAAMKHEQSNKDTSERIKRTLRNRFTQGEVVQCVVFGYLKPPGTKHDSGLQKDSAAESIYKAWFHRGNERFADLGGLDSLKSFCLRSLRQQGQSDPRRRPKGTLLLSPPGCGKSQFCKALGNEVGRPTLILDIGSLMGSLVGQTEGNIRQALRIADAMSPCILMCDEVEKALSGVAASGASDSGVSARLFGTLLTWLNDRTSDVYVICTCNDIAKLPPEFSRAERFDGVFFIELPGVQERRAIWNIYVDMYGLDRAQPKPVDADWTGAEIKAACRLAALLDVPLVEAAQNVVPVARTASEAVAKLRHWASGRCLSADRPGVYAAVPETDGVKPRRKIRGKPSNN